MIPYGIGPIPLVVLRKAGGSHIINPGGVGAAEHIKTDLDFYLLLFCFLATNSSDAGSLIPGQPARDGTTSEAGPRM